MKLKSFIILNPFIYLILLCTLCSCNKNEEDIYQYDNIIFSLEENDGINYIKESLTEISVSNNGDTDIIAPRYNIYQNFQESYHFTSENSFQPSNNIQIPIAIEIWEDGTIEKSTDNYTYNNEETIISNLHELSPEFIIPPHKHLEVKGEITIKKITLTYLLLVTNVATNIKYEIKGKFNFCKPTTINYKSKISDL